MTIAILGKQMLEIAEMLHDAGYTYGNNFSLTNIILDRSGERFTLLSYERCLPYKDVMSGLAHA